MRDLASKIDNTAPANTGRLPAEEFNATQIENEAAVSTSGITLDPFGGPDSSLTMLAQSQARYASGGVFYQDSGTANTYVLSSPTSFEMPKAYFEGMRIKFVPGNDSTGASTINVNAIGLKKIFDFEGNELTPGIIAAGFPCVALFDPNLDNSDGAFFIMPWAEASRFAFLGLNPVFPEIETVDNKLTITDNANGTLTIDAGQTWLWRGLTRFSSDDFIAADRTVTTVADTTYHVRWHGPGTGLAVPVASFPFGTFELIDLTIAVPSEEDPIYDTTSDRMLIARVVTDGSNIPTITTLVNKHRITANGDTQAIGTTADFEDNTPPSQLLGVIGQATVVLNWSRQPEAYLTGFTDVTAQRAVLEIAELNVVVQTRSRYEIKTIYQRTISPDGAFIGFSAFA